MPDEIKILKDLLKQVENNYYEGYDPYDLKGTELYSKKFYTNNFSSKFKRKFIDVLDIFASKLGRRLFLNKNTVLRSLSNENSDDIWNKARSNKNGTFVQKNERRRNGSKNNSNCST